MVCNGGLVGAVSFGYGCGKPNFPGVYASVPYYADWINSVIYEEQPNAAAGKTNTNQALHAIFVVLTTVLRYL